MKKMMFLSKNEFLLVFFSSKALIYYTVNKSHHNSFILLVFSHVANFRYVANFRFLTLPPVHLFMPTKVKIIYYESQSFTPFQQLCPSVTIN